MILRAVAIGALCAGLCACDPASWTLAGIAVDVGLHGYQLASQVQAGAAQGIEIACRALIAKEAALAARGNAAKVAALEQWSGASAFCDPANPPPSDPIAAAFWLGTVIARLD